MTGTRRRTHPGTADGVLAVDVGGTKIALRAVAAGAAVYERTVAWPVGGDAGGESELLEASVAEAAGALGGAPPSGSAWRRRPTSTPTGPW
ncbi:hypothetical protein [Streptomyces hayashii]|uniref:hypothetical protein n=1 Tax=Streptomyces hayashii TaxID=2839966 RepID=UPI00403CD0EE